MPVDPATDVKVRFTEAVQLLSIGPIDGAGPPLPFGGVSLELGQAAQRVFMPNSVEPTSPFDLSEYRITPAFPVPGLEGPGATVQLDPTSGAASITVAYEGPVDPMTGQAGALGDGAVSTVMIESALQGMIPFQPNILPQFRSIQWAVSRTLSVSGGDLSGIPTDIAYDELFNRGALPAIANIFSAGSPLPANSKATIRRNGSALTPVTVSRYLLTAVPREGRIDVFDVGSAGSPRVDVNIYHPGVQSIVAPDVTALTTYWRQ